MRVIDASFQGLWPLDLRTHSGSCPISSVLKTCMCVCVYASKVNTFLIVSLAQTPYLAGLLLPYRTLWGHLGKGTTRTASMSELPLVILISSDAIYPNWPGHWGLPALRWLGHATAPA